MGYPLCLSYTHKSFTTHDVKVPTLSHTTREGWGTRFVLDQASRLMWQILPTR